MRATTSRILLDKALAANCGAECVQWAVALLVAGVGGAHAARLAGMMPPFNHFELAELRDKTLREIGAPEVVPGLESARHLLAECMDVALCDEGSLREIVVLAARMYIDFEHRAAELQPFYLLTYARQDLETGHEQWYWDGATMENIDDITRSEANRFIEAELGRARGSTQDSGCRTPET